MLIQSGDQTVQLKTEYIIYNSVVYIVHLSVTAAYAFSIAAIVRLRVHFLSEKSLHDDEGSYFTAKI